MTMTLRFPQFLILFLSCFLFVQTEAQNTQNKTATTDYPDSFTIRKTDLEALFAKKPRETFSSAKNKYLDQSEVMMNTLNGDMKFLKARLHYFSNAFLLIQVNGEYSTQVFILSDDKSVFYKGRPAEGDFTMNKCDEDEIVSE